MSDARAGIYERISREIRQRKRRERAFAVGVTGIDCSGKTEFTAGLEAHLRKAGYPTEVVHLDEFHQPAAVRHGGANRDEDHYQRVKAGKVFDFDRLTAAVLRPAREGKPFTTRIESLDPRTDAAGSREPAVTRDTVIILEGVFLLLDSVRPYLDYVIFLDASEEECLHRARERDPESVYRRYFTRYLPAARAYLADYPPDVLADLIVENTDWRAPRLQQGYTPQG